MRDGALLGAGLGAGALLAAACLRPGAPSSAAAAEAPDAKPYIAVLKDGSEAAARSPALCKAYALVRNGDGSMDNVMTIHSLNPATMEAHAAIYMQCMKGDSPLSKADREIVAVAASRCNRCSY